MKDAGAGQGLSGNEAVLHPTSSVHIYEVSIQARNETRKRQDARTRFRSHSRCLSLNVEPCRPRCSSKY